MSDTRVPYLILTKSLPQFRGNKTPEKCKVEVFVASDFRNMCRPGSRSFYPRVPCKGDARERYWATHYRLRVDGVWLCKKYQYQFFTLAGVYRFFASV